MSIEIMNLRCRTITFPYDVRVDKQSVFGNPYPMRGGKGESRDDVCEKYEVWFGNQLSNSPVFIKGIGRLQLLLRKHGQLRLFCWCAPKRCHAETIRTFLLEGV